MDLIPPLAFADNRFLMLHGGARAVALGAAGPVRAAPDSEDPEQTPILVTAHRADHGNCARALPIDPRSPCDEAADERFVTFMNETSAASALSNFRSQ
ncbi:MAG: hypothetical protein OEU94_07685 [Aquincola sp.]|nr:hypothetical protein [Aquincola sp.]MDH4287802.1 hypothetical protein [Aquincola sp.]MDH5330758.1 hypothetical protein [Aquincola sp.]